MDEPDVRVEAVVFDIGGVLLDWDPRHLYEQLIPDEQELDRFLGEICTLEWNGIFDAGTSFDDGCRALAEQHPQHEELIHAWKRQDDMIRGELAGTRAVVDRLHAAGVPLYLLTNMPGDVFEARRARFDVFSRFDGAVVSGVEGLLKPDPRIFELVLERFALDPTTTLFVDDALRNVEAAAAVGFVTHHFTDAATLEAFVDRTVPALTTAGGGGGR